MKIHILQTHTARRKNRRSRRLDQQMEHQSQPWTNKQQKFKYFISFLSRNYCVQVSVLYCHERKYGAPVLADDRNSNHNQESITDPWILIRNELCANVSSRMDFYMWICVCANPSGMSFRSAKVLLPGHWVLFKHVNTGKSVSEVQVMVYHTYFCELTYMELFTTFRKRNIYWWIDRQTKREAEKYTDDRIEGAISKRTDIYKQINRKTDRQTGPDKMIYQTGKQIDRQTNRYTEWNIDR